MGSSRLQHLLSCVLFLVAACGRGSADPAASLPAVRAASHIGESFGTATDAKTGQPTVTLRKEALEREFLLQGSLIEQPIAATGTALRSRIVVFKRQGARLYLLEATQGHSVTSDLPQKLILAEFCVTHETADEIEFDFNTGMSAVFRARDWMGHDSKGRDYVPNFEVAHLRLSYLEEVKIAPENRLVIRQIAQLRVPAKPLQPEQVLPVEVRYFLSPYRPSRTFQPFAEADFKNVGFFEVAPRLKEDGSQEIHSVKFDSSKPIVFAISANTPAAYHDAVRDGILYWKSILPSIQAATAPAGVTAPDFDHNVIQWVNHDRKGTAYADAQMDPRTGEVLHGQAFITSAFAFGATNRVRALLKRWEVQDKKPLVATRAVLEGFESQKLCEFDGGEVFQRSLASLLATKAGDDAILRAAQDYIRSTVAHEVGHLLGLRHNFAASLQVKNYAFADRQRTFREYLVSDTVAPDLQTASSVMDYLPSEDSILEGAQMRKQKGKIAPHDRLSIEVLYLGKKISGKDLPPFCSDSDLGKYPDCRQHDSGQSLVEYSSWASRQALEKLPSSLIETFLSAKSPPPWDAPRPIESVSLNPSAIAASLVRPQQELVESLDAPKYSLLVARQFPYVGPLNEELVKERQLQAIESEVSRMGGWNHVLRAVPSRSFEKLFDETERLLRDPYYQEGIGAGGQKYELTKEETGSILASTLELTMKLPDLVTLADIDLLKKLPAKWKVGGTPTGDELAKLLSNRATEYLLHIKSSTIEADVEITTVTNTSITDPSAGLKLPLAPSVTSLAKMRMRLPEFFYSQEVREKAVTLLASVSTVDGIDWGFAERNELRSAMKKVLDRACGCNFEGTSAEKLRIANAAGRKKVVRWFLENRKILKGM